MKTCRRLKTIRRTLRKSKKKHGGTMGLNRRLWGKSTLAQYIDIVKQLQQQNSTELQNKYKSIRKKIKKTPETYINKSVMLLEDSTFEDDIILLTLLTEIYNDISLGSTTNLTNITTVDKTITNTGRILPVINNYYYIITGKYLKPAHVNCDELKKLYTLIYENLDIDIKDTLNSAIESKNRVIESLTLTDQNKKYLFTKEVYGVEYNNSKYIVKGLLNNMVKMKRLCSLKW